MTLLDSAEDQGSFNSAQVTVNTLGATLIVAAFSVASGAPIISTPTGDTWVLLHTGTSRVRLAYILNPTPDAAYVVDVTGIIGGASLAVEVWDGIVAFWDYVEAANVVATSIQPGALGPPPLDGALFISGFSSNNNTGNRDGTIDSGFTIDLAAYAPAVAGFSVSSALAYKGQVSAAVEDPTWSDAFGPPTTSLSAAMAIFLPAVPGAAEATIDQEVIEVAGAEPLAEASIDQQVIEAVTVPTIPVTIDQFIIEYIPGSGSGPTPGPGPAACPPNFPVEPGSGDPACEPSPIIP